VKVLFLTPSLSGTSETFIRDLIFGLASQGVQLIVACGDPNINIAKATPSNVEIKYVPFLALSRISDRLMFKIAKNKREWSPLRDTLFDENASRHLTNLVDAEKPDLVYAEFGWTLARTSKVLYEKSLPIVAHVHGADLTAQLNQPGYPKALELALQETRAVIAASHHMRRLATLAGAPRNLTHVIRLGVDVEGLEPIAWRDRQLSPPSIVFLGRMVAKKNPVALIEAFARVYIERSDVKLNMIGDGPERSKAEDRAKKLGLADSVTWHGELNRKQALEIVRNCWVYAQHSVTPASGDQEGFGISIAEASALELPVVSTIHNGIPEQITDGYNGFLVQEYDFEAMAERILKLIESPDICEQMGKLGRANVIQQYSPQQRATSVHDLFCSIRSSASRTG